MQRNIRSAVSCTLPQWTQRSTCVAYGRIGGHRSHCAPVATEKLGRRHKGTLALACPQNSSCTARTTSAPREASTAKQMLSSLAPCATAITLTSRRATAEKTRPRIPHVPFIDSPSTATTAISLIDLRWEKHALRQFDAEDRVDQVAAPAPASPLRRTSPSACSGEDCVAKSTSVCSCPRRRKSLPQSSTGCTSRRVNSVMRVASFTEVTDFTGELAGRASCVILVPATSGRNEFLIHTGKPASAAG